MILRWRTLPEGDGEIRDIENGITVDTSLTQHWLREIILEATIPLDRFDKLSLVKMLRALAKVETKETTDDN